MDFIFNVKKSSYFCIACYMKVDFRLYCNIELPCVGQSFIYLLVELGVTQHKSCLIPDRRIKRFSNAEMSI